MGDDFLSDIVMSICCLVYNHEKYLRKMLDSLVCQKTDFKYEILINDDASTDKSPEIIKEYQQKYPDLIKPVFQTENQYSKKVPMSNTFLFPRVKGEFVCFCEGDDFWCDENKLQEQYNIMKAHPECSICTHCIQLVKENGEYIKGHFPERKIETGIIEQEQYAQWLLAEATITFQLTSYCIKAELIHALEADKLPEFYKASPVGDAAILRYCLNFGKVYFLNKTMSCYRINSIGSWSLREFNTCENKINHFEKMKKMDLLYNEFSGGKFEKYIKEGQSYYDFLICQYRKNFRDLRKPEFKKFWNKLKLKTRIKYSVCVYFPIADKIWDKIRGR